MYSNDLICDIINFIDSNINKKISIDEISNYFHFNRYYIMKLFKKELDISIVNYINEKRISNSLKDLQNNNDTILKIALDNGFYSQEYFSEMFNKIIGVSPMKYKSFLKYKQCLSQEEIDLVLNNSFKLNDLEEKISKYLQNKKLENTKRVLSIFK